MENGRAPSKTATRAEETRDDSGKQDKRSSSWDDDERSPFVPLTQDLPRNGHREEEVQEEEGPPFPEQSVFYLPDNVRRELGWCFWMPPPDIAVEMPFQ